MDNFNYKKYLKEGRLLKENLNISLTPNQKEEFHRLNTLRDELRLSIDPDNEYYDYDGRDEVEIRADIRAEFGDKIADQIEDGEYEMHYPRDTGVPGFQSPDKLARREKWGHNKYRVTKSGKMNKQDVNRMKNQYKRGY